MKQQTEPTKKNTQKCTQDIRLVPPSAYALPTDKRQHNQLQQERKALMMLLSSYANPDGSGIAISVLTMAKAMGWSERTIQYRLKELVCLGFVEGGKIDGRYHTRVWKIYIPKVTGVPAEPEKGAELAPEDSTEKGAELPRRVQNSPEKGAELTEKGAELADQSAVTAITDEAPKDTALMEPPAVKTPVIDLEDCRRSGSMGRAVEPDQVPDTTILPSTQDPIASYTPPCTGMVPPESESESVNERVRKYGAELMAETDTGHSKIVIEAQKPMQDPLAGSERGTQVRKAREYDQMANGWYDDSERCMCCRIHRADPNSESRVCTECGNCDKVCAIQERLIAPYADGLAVPEQKPLCSCGRKKTACSVCGAHTLCIDCECGCKQCGTQHEIKAYTQCGVACRVLAKAAGAV